MTKRRNRPNNPQGEREMREALRLELHADVLVPDPSKPPRKNGSPRQMRVKKFRLVQRALVNKAIRGDVPAIKEINERMDGRVVQQVSGVPDAPPIKHEHSGPKGGAIPVKHDYSGLSDDQLSRLHAEKVGASRSG